MGVVGGAEALRASVAAASRACTYASAVVLRGGVNDGVSLGATSSESRWTIMAIHEGMVATMSQR